MMYQWKLDFFSLPCCEYNERILLSPVYFFTLFYISEVQGTFY